MDKTTFLNTLQETRAQWEGLLAQIGEERMLQPGATGKWSVKDVIAHVMSGEREMMPIMLTHVIANYELLHQSDDERNEIVYQQNRERPLQDILSEERQAYADLLAAAQTLSDDDLNDPHHFQHMPEDWMPWRLFAGDSFMHYESHMPDLRAWVTRSYDER